jgi:hypothetical protein
MPRRILVCGVVMALWMLLGLTLHLGVEAYLLAGVPWMLAFQRLVRGILDPYLLGGERGTSAAWASAVAGSALWGLWHLPVVLAPGAADRVTVFRRVLSHVGPGAMLCFVARTAGTLAPSAAVHGMADAFRNVP